MVPHNEQVGLRGNTVDDHSTSITCRVNGAEISADVPSRMLLSDYLRHELRLTGTHVGCEMGVCGACTVIIDGQPARSCLIFASQADGMDIRTVESLEQEGDLSDLQEAFRRNFAVQCGYCTPGVLMTLTALREAGDWPTTEDEAREVLSGNICRCTGYQQIVDAVLSLGPQK